MNLKKSIILVIFQCVIFNAIAQPNYTWWNNLHNWDGVSDWTKYITLSPKYMGPNALPVPEIKEGILYKKFYTETAVELHAKKGGFTQNLYSKLYYPVNNKIAFEIYSVPIEHYKTDIATRDERKSRDYDAKGFSIGDLYFGTTIQLLKDKKNLPDVTIGFTSRTASGTNLPALRYTDTPGYFFDIALGKSVTISSKINLRLYAYSGMYVWHTFNDLYHQIDAVLYGGGAKIELKNFMINQSFGGYSGYLNNGDRPMVYRFDFILKKVHFDLAARYQLGIKDFPFHSFRFSFIHYLKFGN